MRTPRLTHFRHASHSRHGHTRNRVQMHEDTNRKEKKMRMSLSWQPKTMSKQVKDQRDCCTLGHKVFGNMGQINVACSSQKECNCYDATALHVLRTHQFQLLYSRIVDIQGIEGIATQRHVRWFKAEIFCSPSQRRYRCKAGDSGLHLIAGRS